jgi:hypothetical protein
MPSFVSEKAKKARSAAMAMSQTATTPVPPPIAGPLMRPITGLGHV